MSATQDIQNFIEHKAYQLRVASLQMTTQAGSGHPTSCLSAADIVATLFFYGMHFDPSDPDNLSNDRFILSKGHAAPLLYAVWKELGMLSRQDLMGYRHIDSVLEGHPTRRFKYAEAATGSLGIGLSIGAGMALSQKMSGRDSHIFVLLGDGELAEGSIWEAAEIAYYYKLDNLIGIVDCNRLGQSAESLHGHHVQRFADKFHAFGFKTEVVDGHDVHHLMMALDHARKHQDSPTMILAKTFKGHGVNLFEDKQGFHGKVLTPEKLQIALEQLNTHFSRAGSYTSGHPAKPAQALREGRELIEGAWKPMVNQSSTTIPDQKPVTLDDPTYKMGEQIATRKAYGQGLRAVGRASEQVVALDAEVKNSTFADIFEERFPERFVQCFIAEQNMVSMAVGFDRLGKIPFVSTFAAFFSRAYDQVRMAAIGTARLRLVGSHAGVSIGQDGPSQMGLEDIALMRALPDSIVLYPCDAVSTYKLVNLMANYTTGISYLRTTRAETPVIYPDYEEFAIGGCKVVRQSDTDVACIVAAGITLHEALKAYDLLQMRGVSVAVIDLYSIKPLDDATLKTIAQKGSGSERWKFSIQNYTTHIYTIRE